MQQDGFTLVELLLALALLGMLIPLCLQMEANTVGYICTTRLRTEATRLAESIMERELAKPSPGALEGTEGLYRWEVKHNADQLAVRVTWLDRGQERQFEVVTLVAAP